MYVYSNGAKPLINLLGSTKKIRYPNAPIYDRSDVRGEGRLFNYFQKTSFYNNTVVTKKWKNAVLISKTLSFNMP
jgi:hypothetical protein